MRSEQENTTWYVLRGSTVLGPYDVETFRRYLLLGRVRLTDRVSEDGRNWQPVTRRAELIPEEMRDLESEAGRARFEAARRAVDERREDAPPPQIGPAPRRRDDDPASGLPGTRVLLGVLVLATALVLLAIGYHETWLHGPAGPPNCDAPPGPGINWSYCTKDQLRLEPRADLAGLRAVNTSLRDADLSGADLQGAVLAYADLTGANLSGANLRDADLDGALLRGTDLRNATLVDARLSHADLRDARLAGADLTGAEARSVVWPDGEPCSADTPQGCVDR